MTAGGPVAQAARSRACGIPFGIRAHRPLPGPRVPEDARHCPEPPSPWYCSWARPCRRSPDVWCPPGRSVQCAGACLTLCAARSAGRGRAASPRAGACPEGLKWLLQAAALAGEWGVGGSGRPEWCQSCPRVPRRADHSDPPARRCGGPVTERNESGGTSTSRLCQRPGRRHRFPGSHLPVTSCALCLRTCYMQQLHVTVTATCNIVSLSHPRAFSRKFRRFARIGLWSSGAPRGGSSDGCPSVAVCLGILLLRLMC